MKKRFALALLMALAALFVGVGCASYAAAAGNGGDKEAGMKEVYDFLKGCGNYYLATVEGDQPRVRPFGSLAIFESKIYFQTGKIKDVSKQMATNPKIEICAFDGKGAWVRVQAVAVDDPRREAKQFLLDAHPELKNMYSADDDNTQVLYLKDAVARFHSFSGTGEPRIVEF
ncbi:MAG: pyridoxamine 5'-phosphate oxidase family protein [Synergistaceae bacterium]|jgi:uncharacterized pyridoxamine 5'-phosphate oxidase family protein|nr:pyridoxamine 5'-phosphate oxidase family protein [Synergistaceae bacterium]